MSAIHFYGDNIADLFETHERQILQSEVTERKRKITLPPRPTRPAPVGSAPTGSLRSTHALTHILSIYLSNNAK